MNILATLEHDSDKISFWRGAPVLFRTARRFIEQPHFHHNQAAGIRQVAIPFAAPHTKSGHASERSRTLTAEHSAQSATAVAASKQPSASPGTPAAAQSSTFGATIVATLAMHQDRSSISLGRVVCCSPGRINKRPRELYAKRITTTPRCDLKRLPEHQNACDFSDAGPGK